MTPYRWGDPPPYLVLRRREKQAMKARLAAIAHAQAHLLHLMAMPMTALLGPGENDMPEPLRKSELH